MTWTLFPNESTIMRIHFYLFHRCQCQFFSKSNWWQEHTDTERITSVDFVILILSELQLWIFWLEIWNVLCACIIKTIMFESVCSHYSVLLIVWAATIFFVYINQKRPWKLYICLTSGKSCRYFQRPRVMYCLFSLTSNSGFG